MKELYEKLFNIQGLSVKKEAENPFFHCKYADLDSIMGVLMPILKDNDLLLYHASKDGAVETHLVDVKTEKEIVSSFKLPELQDVQKLGGGVTYAKRYNIGQLFNIITDKDDDGNSASGKVTHKQPKWDNQAKDQLKKNPVQTASTVFGKQ